MALTTQMLEILLEEYFCDPTSKKYKFYGNLIKSDGCLRFYIPSILSLANESQDIYYYNPVCKNGKDIYENRIKRRKRPSRICEIFSGIEGAPNSITPEDVIDAFVYYYTIHPELFIDIPPIQVT